MGPLNDELKQRTLREQGDIKYEITWNTLAEYLRYLEKRGVSCNVASFIGATTIREHVVGFEDQAARRRKQLERMRELVRLEMEAGALGIGTSLIYPPAFYAKTEELIELCKVAAKYKGKYISHMRSEGNQLLEALEELIRIAREANIPAEIYHIKAAGRKELGQDGCAARASRSRAQRKASRSRPTCTPTPPPAPGSTPVCRPGRRTAVIRRYSSGCATRRRARRSQPK